MSDAKSELMPMTIKVRQDVRDKLKKVAKAHGLSLQYVTNLSTEFGLVLVEKKLKDLKQPA